MKKLIYIIIIILMLLLIPVIPYDKELKSGAVVIEHKTVIEWMIDNY